MLDLKGLTPVGVRTAPQRPLLQWRTSGGIRETDFSRFRPVRVFPVPPRNDLRVVWRDFTDLTMNAPFFKDAMDQSEKQDGASDQFETEWDVLSSVAAQPGNVPLSGLVCHMARTGSTLIHRVLSRSGVVLSLSEVPMVDRVLYLGEEYPEEQRRRMMRDLVAAYGQPRRPAENHYVLKMTDAAPNTRLADLRAAFPEVPWIFVYRDPVEVMVSLIRQPTGTIKGWMRNRTRVAQLLRMRGLSDGSLWPEQFMARTLRRFCLGAVEAARATPPGLFLAVNYARLPEAIWESIAPHFGITLTARERELMQAEARLSAKRRDAVAFTPDSKKKHEEAGPRVRNLAENLVGAAVDELRSLPQA